MKTAMRVWVEKAEPRTVFGIRRSGQRCKIHAAHRDPGVGNEGNHRRRDIRFTVSYKKSGGKKVKKKESCRSGLKACTVRTGMTMGRAVDCPADEYGWSSVPKLLGRLKCGGLRYKEAAEPADAPGDDTARQKRKGE